MKMGWLGQILVPPLYFLCLANPGVEVREGGLSSIQGEPGNILSRDLWARTLCKPCRSFLQ